MAENDAETPTPAMSINEKEELDIDEVLDHIGAFGKFQIIILMFCMYSIFVNAYQSITIYFEGDNPSWTCTPTMNTSHFCRSGAEIEFDNTHANFTQRCHLQKDEWKYSKEKSYSYVTEWDLVCERSALAATIGGVFFIGSAIASVVTGTLADIYGRRIILFIALINMSICSIMVSFVSEIWQLIALRFLIGASEATGVALSYIYLTEFSTSKSRSVAGNICNVSYTVALFFLVSVAYVERQWRRLQLFVSLPALVAVVACFFLPKSPRWLLATGNVSESKSVLKKIASANGKPYKNFRLRVPNMHQEESVCEKKYTYFDFFKSLEVIVLVLVQGFMWLALGLMFFSVTLQSSNLGGNIYTSFIFIGLPDLPCCLIAMYLCKRIGTKRTVLMGLGISGILIGSVAIAIANFNSSYVTNMILSICGKSFLNIAFNAIHLWCVELFPTVLRTQGFSLCIIMSRVGGAAAPFLSEFLQIYRRTLPYESMAALGIGSALIGMILPETYGCRTREHYEDFFTNKKNLENEMENASDSSSETNSGIDNNGFSKAV